MADVRIENISVGYGDKMIIRDVSLNVKDGECFAILGPSACGKTTLARAICGFNKLDEGTITIGDRLVSSRSKRVHLEPERRDLGVVFQDYAVWPHMTVYENVFYPLKKRRVDKMAGKKLAMDAIEQVRMSAYADRFPSQLSGGQQQRVALARALVASGELLILDEPITNLDANLREEMRFEIKELQKRISVTVIYITHDQGDAMAIADRMAVMDGQGNIRQTGTPEEVYGHPADSFIYRFIGISNFLPVERKAGQLFIMDGAERLPFTAPPADDRSEDNFFIATHPIDLEVVKTGAGLAGMVKHVTFLGNIYDYRVQAGSYEIRVQQDAARAEKNGVPREGEACVVRMHRAKYYADDQGGSL